MANPYLVLGGIAIGVAAAAFGILQVPGWLSSAQDAAAQNDIASASAAQSAAVSTLGHGHKTIAELKDTSGLNFQVSDGVTLDTDANGAQFGVIATSASGHVFGRVNGGGIHMGDDRADLISNPDFACGWVNAGLKDIGIDPALCGDAGEPGPGFFVADGHHRFQMDMFGQRMYILYSAFGSSSGSITVGDTGDGWMLITFVNGSLGQGFFGTEAELWSAVNSDNSLRTQWQAAGFGTLDLSAGTAGWDGTIMLDESASGEEAAEVERIAVGWNIDFSFARDMTEWTPALVEGSIRDDQANGHLAFLEGRTPYTSRSNGGTNVYVLRGGYFTETSQATYYIGIGSQSTGWKRWIANSPEELGALPEVVKALADAGMTPWWLTGAPR